VITKKEGEAANKNGKVPLAAFFPNLCAFMLTFQTKKGWGRVSKDTFFFLCSES